MSNTKEELLNTYDKLCNITVINIYSLSKENNKIILSPKEDNLSHLFFLYTSIQVASNFNKKLLLSMRPFKFIHYISKNFGKKGFEYFKWTWEKPNINIDEILQFEAKGNNVDVSIFEDIYKEYYDGIL